MNKRTFIAISVAVLLPLVSYLIVSHYSTTAVVMPKRYFYDTVININDNGKNTTDTIWHKVRPIVLTNQFGKSVTLNDSALKGKILVVDFIFTSCPTICPTLTRNMKRIQDAFKTDSVLRYVSITIDPARDSAAKLKAFGDKYNVNHDTWSFLTGPRDSIYYLALNEFKANIAETEVDTNFIHTQKFFLLDKDRVVRGWYDGLDSTHLDKLINDAVLLMLERDKKKKRNLFRK